jgi:transcriptional regulator with XRE-family HTH domain
MIYSEQIRAARSLIGWNQQTLAARADVGIATVRRLESKDGPLKGQTETMWALQRALEAAGVKFIEDDGTNGPGVRLQTSQKT